MPSPPTVPRPCHHLLISLLLGEGKWADVNSEVLANSIVLATSAVASTPLRAHGQEGVIRFET